MADHTKEELEKCKLVCELVNLQRLKPEFTNPNKKCTCSIGSMYKNLGRSDCPNCGGKF